MASLLNRLVALTEELPTILRERKLPQEVHDTKARAWQLAAELATLEARVPKLRMELAQAVETLEKTLHPAAPTAPVAKEGGRK